MKKYIYAFVALATFTTLATAVPALAQNTATNQSDNNGIGVMMRVRGGLGIGKGGNKAMMRPAVFGTVSAINGNIITVTSKQGLREDTTTTTPATVTYTVDATNAKIMKNNVAGTISSIVIGDTIVAQGTLTGTNLVATNIRDGVMARGQGGDANKTEDKNKQNITTFTGNGQPIVAGTVSVVNGSTLTIVNKSNVTYTIDTTNAKIMQGSNTITISNVVVGDNILAQGTVNGNAVVASTVIDQKVQTTNGAGSTQSHKGFFGSIGSFFAHLFGY